jgi:hypothetical protein
MEPFLCKEEKGLGIYHLIVAVSKIYVRLAWTPETPPAQLYAPGSVSQTPNLPLPKITVKRKKPPFAISWFEGELERHLFHLNGTRRFASDIIDDATDTVDLIDDPPADSFQKLAVEREPVGGHEISCFHGTEDNHLSVHPLVSHDTDHTHIFRQDSCKSLRDLSVQASGDDFVDEDLVGLTSDLELCLVHLADDPDGQAWAWEWMSPYQLFWNSEVCSQCSDFVLEELSQGLDQLQMHTLEKSTNVVVGFNGG